MSLSNSQHRAQQHAKHGYFCECGRLVHGNGARAMHFYANGDKSQGLREGHRLISRDSYLARFGHPLDHPANQ